jgi:UPF0716 family protein affecting phage T7 exclusion
MLLFLLVLAVLIGLFLFKFGGLDKLRDRRKQYRENNIDGAVTHETSRQVAVISSPAKRFSLAFEVNI